MTDPAIIADGIGVVIAVARYMKTTSGDLLAMNRRFELAGVRISGCIMNAIDPRAAAGYGRYYYRCSYESHARPGSES